METRKKSDLRGVGIMYPEEPFGEPLEPPETEPGDPERRKGEKKRERVRCAVAGCKNHSDEGEFVGDLCCPCWNFVTRGGDAVGSSQAYRNAVRWVLALLVRNLGVLEEHLSHWTGRMSDVGVGDFIRTLFVDRQFAFKTRVAASRLAKKIDGKMVYEVPEGGRYAGERMECEPGTVLSAAVVRGNSEYPWSVEVSCRRTG